MIEPIKKRTVAQEVGDRVIDLVNSGQYVPGDRLPTERELADRLKVARTSVREGLKRLESMGLVQMKPGSGTFIQAISVESVFEHQRPVVRLVMPEVPTLTDILAVRQTIEQQTAADAARRATQQQIDRLAHLLGAADQRRDNPSQFIEADLQFHVAVAEASGNGIYPLMVGFLRDLYLKSDFALRVAMVPGLTDASRAHHRKVFQGISARDPEQARSAMAAHLGYNEGIVLRLRQEAVPEAE